MRRTLPINENWKFAKTAVLPGHFPEEGGEWETVTLPHTWNAADGQDGGNDYFRGTCTYVKKLKMPHLADGERVFLDIPGAAMRAEVFINGVLSAEHAGGYSAFRTDITDLLGEDNLLCIRTDNSENDTVYPQMADFTFYGGLYRGVNLIITPQKHFELVKDGTPGIKVTPIVDLETKTAKVTVEAWIAADAPGQGAAAGGTHGQSTCAAGMQRQGAAAEQVTFSVAGQQKTVPAACGYAKAEFTLASAHLWDGLADPYLYTAGARLESGDAIETRFGVRKIEITPEGFFLNGRLYPLRGVSRHQDRAGCGNALMPEMHREDMALIREIGANAVRLAHYQHAQTFYDLCDANGIIAWAEIPYITAHMTNGRENAKTQMRELITQNYNHPSIAVWGLSNEITAAGGVTEELLDAHRELNALCARLDATRPTAMAHVFMLETDSPLVDVPDCGAYNLYYGWYLGELAQNDAFFDKFHAYYPQRPIGLSEYGADANPAFHSISPAAGDYTEEYQCVYHEHMVRMIEARPWLWCTFVWNMFDFAADGRSEGGNNGKNQKGLVTIDRKVKKDAFYLYKAAWSREPFVHICGSRYVNRAEETTAVKVYTNLPEVTLFVDGKKWETKVGEMIFAFEVPISGEHRIEARAGACTDVIIVRKVSAPDPAYIFRRQAVVNWFDQEPYKPDHFSVKDRFDELTGNPKTAEVVGKLMEKAIASRGDVAKSISGGANLQDMMGAMTLESLLARAGDAVSPEDIQALNRALQQIPK